MLSSARWLPLCALVALVRPPVEAQTPAPAPPAVRITGYIQARETYRDGVGLIGSINRARLTTYGSAARDVTWRVQGEFRTGSAGTGRASVSLQDAYVRYKTGAFGVQVGQFKTPFTREFITSLADVETADRATVVDSLAPRRDISHHRRRERRVRRRQGAPPDGLRVAEDRDARYPAGRAHHPGAGQVLTNEQGCSAGESWIHLSAF